MSRKPFAVHVIDAHYENNLTIKVLFINENRTRIPQQNIKSMSIQ